VVDFQQLVTLQREHMGGLERLASLDSPFAEALLARFTQYFGRLGTPDLDVAVLLQRLRAVNDESIARRGCDLMILKAAVAPGSGCSNSK